MATSSPTGSRSRAGLVLGTAAICLAVGGAGGAVAGSLVTGAQIKDGSLSGKDVKNKSLKIQDLDASAVSGLQGPAGLPGTAGAPGSPGAPGQNAYQHVVGSSGVVPAFGDATLTATCPTGTTVLGGGARDTDGALVSVSTSGPAGPDGWVVYAENGTASPVTLTPFATCTRA